MRYQNPDTSPVTGLIIINAALFLVTLAVPRLELSLGLQPSLVSARPWTIFSSMFIHDGWWHIISNMLALYFFGTFLVSLVGGNIFLIIYFGAGLAGNLLVWALAPLFSITVGASGAIYGVGGALAILRPNQKVYIIPIPIPLPLWVAVLGGFLVLFAFAGISWQAHLGGLIFGMIAGYFLKRRYRY